MQCIDCPAERASGHKLIEAVSRCNGPIEGEPAKEINAQRKVELVMKGGTLYERPCAVSLASYSTYKESKVSRFLVDPGDCRSTKERCEIIELNERINAIAL